jgi:PIN domain nuclease of toxin-antitoxin system
MNGYLLDTNILIWAASEVERLSPKILKILQDPHSQLYLSAASCWELAIECEKGAIKLRGGPEQFINQCIERLQLKILSIEWQDGIHCAALPQHHRDPFDRMLIYQAKRYGLTILTSDEMFRSYRVVAVI